MKQFIFLILVVVGVNSCFSNNPDKMLDKFVEVYNSNSEIELGRFIKEHFVDGIDVSLETERWIRWYTVYGPLEFHSEVFSEPSRYRAFYKGKITKAWVELTLLVSRENPEKIRRIPLGSGLKPNNFAIVDIENTSQLTEHLDKYFTDLHHHDYFSGTVLVTSKGETLYEVSIGDADKSRNIPNNENTLFNIASITKVFTATAIFQLWEDGKLNLDDPLSKYVKNYPDSIASKISIRQLLTHTSGIGKGKFDDPIYPQEKLALNELLPLTIAPFDLQPGEYPVYSNGAYVLLGAVIESISEKSYYQYIKENIFDRAKMYESDFYSIDDHPSKKAFGYTNATLNDAGEPFFKAGDKHIASTLNGYRGSPAGLSYSSAVELNAFLNSLLDNSLLSPEFTRLFLSSQVETPPENVDSPYRFSFGFSWEISKGKGYSTISKDGGTWGFSSRMTYIPEKEVNIIVLSNYESIAPIVSEYITDLIIDNYLNLNEENE